MRWRLVLGLFFLFCLWGLFWEWFFGLFWSMIGECPWLYVDSPLRYTSLKVTVLWGLGGLNVIALYRFVQKRSLRRLVYVGALVALVLLYIGILSVVGV